ncbi:MAG: hypothetical protein KBT04_05890 [Bacteroidales bacterium]|nr:hypothetical protein [Candidatus Colimorpha onthohippi]
MNETMNKHTDSQRRTIFGLLGLAGMDREMLATVIDCVTVGRTQHVSELTEQEADEVIDQLHDFAREQGRSRVMRMDEVWRRRVIAAVFGYLDRIEFDYTNVENRLQYVKRIACRAAGEEDFNKIDKLTLQRLYNHFVRL